MGKFIECISVCICKIIATEFNLSLIIFIQLCLAIDKAYQSFSEHVTEMTVVDLGERPEGPTTPSLLFWVIKEKENKANQNHPHPPLTL